MEQITTEKVLMILGAIYAVVTVLAYAFALIAKLTPNKKDDAIADGLKAKLKSLSIFFGKFGIDLRSYVPKEEVDKMKEVKTKEVRPDVQA